MASTAQTTESTSLSQANGKFTEDFYKKVSAGESVNIFFSPLSISMAFAMLQLGARGKTAEEIAKALSVDSTENLHQAYSQLKDLINKNMAKSELLVANRLFGSKDYRLREEYTKDTSKYYDAGLEAMDFKSADAPKVINDWVANKTNDKITNLIKDIDPMTALILVNAIYFKGQWKEKFDKKDTKKKPFYVTADEKVDVDFMSLEEKMPLYFDRESEGIVVELPYSDDNLSMLIVVSKERGGLKQMEEKLRGRLHSILYERRRPMKIALRFPRFKFEYSLSLNDALQSLGMTSVFQQGQADLTGIGERLFVSKAVHKAYVDVNEEGTEAAAATGIMMARYSAHSGPKPINVDHPFLFAIVEKSSKTILFFGRVTKPEYKE